MRLRDYQYRAVRDLRAALARHRSIVLALQVGGGKTVIACEVIRRTLERGRRCLFLVHRAELVEQAVARLERFGLTPGVIKAGYDEDRSRPVQVACIPTLIRREFPQAALVLVDEAHHAVSESWSRVIGHYREAGAWILGITATPHRLDGRGLGALFERIVEPVTTADLVDAGHLIEPTVYAPPSVDLTGVRTRGGDYVLPELADRMGSLTGSLTGYWDRFCRDRRALVFAVDIEHSRRIEEALADAGANVAHVDGKSSVAERRAANAGLRDGSLDVVTQCALWTEGVDIPELDALIVARPTQSLGLHRQMIGRVMRPAPGKRDALVLDHAGNHHRHGTITEDVEWSLDGRKKTAGPPPVRVCRECYAVVPAAAQECPRCGAILAPEESKPPEVDNPGELKKLNRRTPTAVKRSAYRDLVRIASERGYKLAWARIRYRDTYGVWPRYRALERKEYECSGHEWETREYGPRTVTRCSRCYARAAEGIPG